MILNTPRSGLSFLCLSTWEGGAASVPAKWTEVSASARRLWIFTAKLSKTCLPCSLSLWSSWAPQVSFWDKHWDKHDYKTRCSGYDGYAAMLCLFFFCVYLEHFIQILTFTRNSFHLLEFFLQGKSPGTICLENRISIQFDGSMPTTSNNFQQRPWPQSCNSVLHTEQSKVETT